MSKIAKENIVRVSRETQGYVWTPETADYIDASGKGHPSAIAAARSAKEKSAEFGENYTHYICNGKIRKIEG